MRKLNIATIRKFVYFLCVFLILFYPFNTSIIGHFYPNGTYIILSVVVSMFLLIIFSLKSKNIFKIKKIYLALILFSFIIFLLTLIRNYYFIENRSFYAIIFSLYLFMPIIFCRDKEIINCFEKVLVLFCIEHIFFTFFIAIFRDTYLNSIYPYIANGGHPLARSQFLQGFNPGLTTHYTTNAIYLSISFIYFFSKYNKDKKKLSLLFTILSFICVLLTAKRGHLIFSCISIAFYFLIINREKLSKKIFVSILIIIVAFLGVFALSFKYPNILKFYERFESSSDSSSLLNGRDKLYKLAMDKWKKSPIIGHGWVAYTYFYHNELRTQHDAAYGIDYCSTHNVYLELLCDTGIVGLLIFIIISFSILNTSRKCLKKYEKNHLLVFSMCYQIFFLLYCLSGNPLYDVQCFSIFFISIGIVLFYFLKSKEEFANE